MRYASVPAEVKVPVVIALVQVVLFHPIFEGLQIPDPFAPSYDFAVPLGSQKIMAENFFRIFCHDLLAPEGYGEIIGGGERIWDLKTLEDRMEQYNLNKSDYYWYLDLRRYGSIPHSGFGLGLDRLAMWIMHLETIRDAIPYPRTIRRIKP